MAKKQHTFGIGCLTGTGQTAKEAKEDAIYKASTALDQSYVPVLVDIRGAQAVIYQTPLGYAAAVVPEKLENANKLTRMIWYSEPSLHKLTGKVFVHLAQQTFDGKDVSCPFDAVLYKDEADDYRKWCRFQVEYVYLRSLGFNDTKARNIQGGFPTLSSFTLAEQALVDQFYKNRKD